MTPITPNAQRLLRCLVADGPAYRADLARALDVSRATVTNLTNRLISDGWIEELENGPGSLKNPIGTTAQLGALASVMFLVDSYTVTLARLDGRVLSELTLTGSPALKAEERLSAAAALLDQHLAEHSLMAKDLHAVHLAVDTQMDAQSGEIYAQRASSRWYGVNPKMYFGERFGVPVYVQNSARLEGLAEYLWGTGKDHENMLYVEVSHGVTSGHIAGGVILSGARGGSGELGHTVYDWSGPLCTCGNAGCLMQYVSIPALLRNYATSSGSEIGWEEFCARVQQGDASAEALTHRAAVILGRTLINVAHLIDPETIVLSGEVPRSLPGFFPVVVDTVRKHALPLVARNLEIVAAEMADVSGSTARAGITSLRRAEDVVSVATYVTA